VAILRTNGFVQLRRGLQEHVTNGSMSVGQLGIYCLLLMNADPSTGIWRGSAGLLAAVSGESPRTCRDAFERLEGAGYIKRFAVQGKHGSYPILVHRFDCSDGAMKGSRLNALNTTDCKHPIYESRHEDGNDNVNESVNEDGNDSAAKYLDNKRTDTQIKKTLAPSSPELSGAGAPAIGTIACVGKGKKSWPIYQAKVDEWQESYPGVDVMAELRKIRQWAIDNRRKRKTFDGMPRFINSWLSKSQDEIGGSTNGNGTAHTGRISVADERKRERARSLQEFLGEDGKEADGPGSDPLPLTKH
jgi:hypothetical protein